MLKSHTPKKNRAQSSMEFFVLSGMGFLVVIVFLGIAAAEINEFVTLRQFKLLEDVSYRVQKEASIAAGVEDGYIRTFTLPDKLRTTVDYFMITQNSTVTINTSKSVHTVAIPDVVGSFVKGANKIEKRNGTIYVNQ